MIRAALYARVSTLDQAPENQLLALRAYALARGWAVTEYVDHGVSGRKERRPQLDALQRAARARQIDAVVCVKLDRLARSTHHLLTLAREWEALGVNLVVIEQAIDTSVPTGRLLFTLLGAIAEFERDLIIDRVRLGMAKARQQGTRSGKAIGRPRQQTVDVARARQLLGSLRSLRAVARALGVHPTAVSRALQPVTKASPRVLAKAASRLRVPEAT